MRLLHSMQFLLQVTYNALYATGFFLISISCCGKIISKFWKKKNEKSNCDLKRIYGINYMFMNLHTYMIFCAVKGYEMFQKNARQVFSVHLSFISVVYKLINSKEMTLKYIKTIDNWYTYCLYMKEMC